MEHTDPEVLALVALGEPVDDAVRAHLTACPTCSAEVEDLAAAVSVGRAARRDTLVPPAPAVWDRISSELGLPADVRPDAGSADGPADRGSAETPSTTTSAPADTSAPAGGPHHGRHAAPAPSSDLAAVGAPGSPAEPVPTGPSPSTAVDSGLAPVLPLRRRRGPWIAAAAAAGLVVGGAGGTLLAGSGDDGEEPPLVAQAALEPLPGWDATGQAAVHRTSDGTRILVVDLEGAVDDDGYREVWLIDRDVDRMFSLGVLEGTQGTFAVPEGIDLAEFPVVDISEEPFDGDPLHSGDSIIRGVLDA